MNDVIGIAWFKDELTYRRALAIFTDSENMPATYEDWKALVGRQCEEIKGAWQYRYSRRHRSGNIYRLVQRSWI